jgi:hypothetical protein
MRLLFGKDIEVRSEARLKRHASRFVPAALQRKRTFARDSAAKIWKKSDELMARIRSRHHSLFQKI